MLYPGKITFSNGLEECLIQDSAIPIVSKPRLLLLKRVCSSGSSSPPGDKMMKRNLTVEERVILHSAKVSGLLD